MSMSKRFFVRARGPLACFTRPELKAERVSYEVMTPSAARGVLEAILWKPAIRWEVEAVRVLAPIKWTAFRRNEVGDKGSPRSDAFYVEDRRQQRNTVALQDVDYLITARFTMTERAGESDSVVKFEEMMTRRLAKGQVFHQPYLGCREFAAEVTPGEPGLIGIDQGIDRPMGLMFYDFDHTSTPPTPLFFEARLKDGSLSMPAREQLMSGGGR